MASRVTGAVWPMSTVIDMRPSAWGMSRVMVPATATLSSSLSLLRVMTAIAGVENVEAR